MFRALRCVLIGVFSMLAATSTYAGEAELSLEGRMGVDTNVLRRPTSPKSASPRGGGSEAAYWEFAPSLRVLERKEPVSYSFEYRGVPTAILRDGNGSPAGITYDARRIATWRDHAVGYRHGVVSEDTTTSADFDSAADVDPADPTRFLRLGRATGNGFASRTPTRLHAELRPDQIPHLGFDFADIDFVSNSNPTIDTVDTRSYTISVSPSFVLDARTSVGFGVTGRYRQNFGKRFFPDGPDFGTDPDPFGADSVVRSGDVSLQVSRQLSPTSSISLAAGPSILHTEVEAAAVGPGINTNDEQLDLSWFAQGSYQKRWQNSRLQLAYSRFESASGGAGASSIVDQATMSFDHRPAERWTVRLIFNWNLREQLVDSDVILNGQDEKTTRYQGVASSIRYRVTKRIFVTSQVQYRYQEQRVKNSGDLASEIFTGFIGLRYTFEPLTY